MSNSNYNRYLINHTKLHESQSQWPSVLYLPPCSCYESDGRKCVEASNLKSYDFEKFDDVDLSSLINICNFIPQTTLKRDDRVLTLCSKYSLHGFKELTSPFKTKKEIVSFVKSSETYKNQLELLRSDFKLLFPLCGTSYIFRSKHTQTLIKFHIQCAKSRFYQDSKSSQSQEITKKRRECVTNRPTHDMNRCPFLINLFLDLETFDWFIKSKGKCQHQFHKPLNVLQYKIGKFQLSSSMIDEIDKLHQSNVSSSTQQNVLMNNNNITVPKATIFNRQYNDLDPDEETLTDAEKLLMLFFGID